MNTDIKICIHPVKLRPVGTIFEMVGILWEVTAHVQVHDSEEVCEEIRSLEIASEPSDGDMREVVRTKSTI